MKKHTYYFAGLLTALLMSVVFPASAADTLNFTKTIPAKAFPNNPGYLLVNLYAAKDDTVPVATQSFMAGEWQVSMEGDNLVLHVELSDLSYLDETPYLWAETEIGGDVVGPRELVPVIAPGISAPGLIESTVEGFKYPDATVQTTAGVTPADLAAHQGNTAAHHNWPITTNEITNGTIAPVDLNATGHFVVGGLTIDGGAQTIIKSDGDIRIHDDINGFRWYNYAGNTQMAFFYISGTTVYFYDDNQNRYLMYSNGNGIGIGTNTTSASHAVTMPSLDVTGDLEIGLTRVSASYALSSSNPCHSAGNLTCYYGSGSVSCPVGTRVLGGGSDGTSLARFGSISQSYPNSLTSWSCASSYDISGASDTCYAICARLE